MVAVDVFNGDADGICALHQLRLTAPSSDARLVTGVKRDIQLLKQLTDIVDAEIVVLDVSLDKNRTDLERLLHAGNRVVYIDHHYSGEIPQSPNLTTHIDPSSTTCTSLIVDRLVGERFTPWALAGAFGDNLDEVAIDKGERLGLSTGELGQLQEIGRLLNYNGYGVDLDDLMIAPEALYREVHGYPDPFDFFNKSETLKHLRTGYSADMALADNITATVDSAHGRIFELPNTAWARRVAGVFSNKLAREQVDKAHALLITNTDGSRRVSVRAPITDRTGADVLCRRFPTGGGRAAAAGINRLPAEQVDDFLSSFSHFFTS